MHAWLMSREDESCPVRMSHVSLSHVARQSWMDTSTDIDAVDSAVNTPNNHLADILESELYSRFIWSIK